jgi:hypothetical protein
MKFPSLVDIIECHIFILCGFILIAKQFSFSNAFFRDGVLVKCEVYGEVQVNSHITGVPDLTLSFTNPSIMDDVRFHPCVRFRPWESHHILSFVPPDGLFKLMSYRSILCSAHPKCFGSFIVNVSFWSFSLLIWGIPIMKYICTITTWGRCRENMYSLMPLVSHFVHMYAVVFSFSITFILYSGLKSWKVPQYM